MGISDLVALTKTFSNVDYLNALSGLSELQI
jgi:hypothetical protein